MKQTSLDRFLKGIAEDDDRSREELMQARNREIRQKRRHVRNTVIALLVAAGVGTWLIYKSDTAADQLREATENAKCEHVRRFLEGMHMKETEWKQYCADAAIKKCLEGTNHCE
ncbi:hypothetical protein HY463_00350 [Candidatus Peregrinibacteria bacterium]|nr:hypothetical protein [Candidatus Peregrinibacteria bacterium]